MHSFSGPKAAAPPSVISPTAFATLNLSSIPGESLAYVNQGGNSI
jgi:hypothetical protein